MEATHAEQMERLTNENLRLKLEKSQNEKALLHQEIAGLKDKIDYLVDEIDAFEEMEAYQIGISRFFKPYFPEKVKKIVSSLQSKLIKADKDKMGSVYDNVAPSMADEALSALFAIAEKQEKVEQRQIEIFSTRYVHLLHVLLMLEMTSEERMEILPVLSLANELFS